MLNVCKGRGNGTFMMKDAAVALLKDLIVTCPEIKNVWQVCTTKAFQRYTSYHASTKVMAVNRNFLCT